MPRTNVHDERQRLRERARDCFLLAAAALTQVPTDEVLGFATLNGALGMLRLAQSDPDEKGLDRVVKILKAMKEKRHAKDS